MAPRGPFRAVTLDLWFTTLYYPPEFDRRWQEERVRVLQDILTAKDGRGLAPNEIESAMETVQADLSREGKNPGTVDPVRLVREYAGSLGADLRIPLEEAGRRFSSAGLDEHPPSVNPEAIALVGGLRARGVPVILLTNTARRGASWTEFLRARTALPPLEVIASCEVGHAKPHPEIFRLASERLGVPPREILHVGDRGELDVDGALGAGFGAALYRGLWSAYPDGLYPDTGSRWLHDPRVLVLDRLEDLLDGTMLGNADGDRDPRARERARPPGRPVDRN